MDFVSLNLRRLTEPIKNMLWTRWRYWNVSLALTIAGITLGGMGGPARSSLPQTEVELARFNPPTVGAPGNRQDAGSRGTSCRLSAIRFLALVPDTNVGLTLEERPTFWLYVPCNLGSVEFDLLDDETDEILYQTKFNMTDGPGIVSFRLPETAPSLEIGTWYRWMFHFATPNSENISFISGVTIREPLSMGLESELENATPRERIEIYGKNGLWHDMLTELGELYRANPEDATLAAEWTEVLQHPVVRLEDLRLEPLVPCCTLESGQQTVRNDESASGEY